MMHSLLIGLRLLPQDIMRLMPMSIINTLISKWNPFRLALTPLRCEHFRAYCQATGHKPAVWHFDQHPSDEILTCIYCHEVTPFCDWLQHIYQEQGWLETGWQLDLPTQAEWAIGFAKFNLSNIEALRNKDVMFSEWLWHTYMMVDPERALVHKWLLQSSFIH